MLIRRHNNDKNKRTIYRYAFLTRGKILKQHSFHVKVHTDGQEVGENYQLIQTKIYPSSLRFLLGQGFSDIPLYLFCQICALPKALQEKRIMVL